MGKIEYISPEGLRVDGRRPGEIRSLKCQFNVIEKADGSVFLEQGNTKVVAAIYGPHAVRTRSQTCADRAVVVCSFSQSSFATEQRRKKLRNDRRSEEIAQSIKNTFESVLFTDLFPRTEISVYINVLQADGGVRSVSMNAACLALMNAGIPMRDFVVACTVGCVESQALVDTNHLEDLSGGPELTVAFSPRTQSISCAIMDSKVPSDVFDRMLDAASDGCKKIHEAMDNELKRFGFGLLLSSGTEAH